MARILGWCMLAISFLGLLRQSRGQNITNFTANELPDVPPGMPPLPDLSLDFGQNGTQAPTMTEDGCYASTNDIYLLITDDDQLFNQKRFVLCPNTLTDIGFLAPGVGILGGQAPLVPRSNTEILCGEDGKAENNCVLRGGDFGLVAVPVFFPQDPSVNNVVIRGFTFEGQTQYNMFVGSPGSIRVEDCVFRNSANYGPIWLAHDTNVIVSDRSLEKYEKYDNPWLAAIDYIEETREYYDNKRQSRMEGSWEEGGGGESSVSGHGGERSLQSDLFKGSFINCQFTGLEQIERAPGVSFGVFTTVGPGSDIELQGCTFADNKYGDDDLTPRGYAISATEVVISIRDCCFINNDFRGFAPIILEMTADPSTILEGNYATTGDDDLDCSLAAYFETEEDRLNFDFECVETQVDECGGEPLPPTSENGGSTPSPAPSPQSTSGTRGWRLASSIRVISTLGVSCLIVGL